jgi:hypothetical protein
VQNDLPTGVRGEDDEHGSRTALDKLGRLVKDDG